MKRLAPYSRTPKEHQAGIVVLGESGVGKTWFCDVFFGGKPFLSYNVTSTDSRLRMVRMDDESWSLDLMDLNSTLLRDPDPDLSLGFFEMSLCKASGIVLLYDVTIKESFLRVTDEAYTFAWKARSEESPDGGKYPAGRRRFGCVLVGSKADIARMVPGSRQVSKEMAEQWAQSQGFRHCEIDSNDRMEVENAIETLVGSIKRARKWDERDLESRKKEQPRNDATQEKSSVRSKMKQLLKSTGQ